MSQLNQYSQYNTAPDAKAIVIYHDNCMDGFTAAWAFYRLAEWRYNGGVEYIPCAYGGEDPIGNCDTDIDLFIVDFSFSRAVITQLAKLVRTVTILDHHKTAQEDLADWTDCPSNVFITFDMNRSGAGITWDFCKDWKTADNAPLDFGNSRAGLVSYVEDRDLWRFKLTNSRPINAYIANVDHTFEAWDELYREILHHYDDVVEIGLALEKQHLRIATQIAKHAAPYQNVYARQYTAVKVNCPPQFASEVGNILAQTYDYAVMWWVDGDGTQHRSLRSDNKCDVSAIAKQYGGGGHKNAAGYKV